MDDVKTLLDGLGLDEIAEKLKEAIDVLKEKANAATFTDEKKSAVVDNLETIQRRLGEINEYVAEIQSTAGNIDDIVSDLDILVDETLNIVNELDG